MGLEFENVRLRSRLAKPEASAQLEKRARNAGLSLDSLRGRCLFNDTELCMEKSWQQELSAKRLVAGRRHGMQPNRSRVCVKKRGKAKRRNLQQLRIKMNC